MEAWSFRENYDLKTFCVIIEFWFCPPNQKAIIEVPGFLTLFYETIKTIIINDYSEDALRMINIASFNKALKSIWIKK